MECVTLRSVSKTYRLDSVNVPALTDVNVEILADRFTVIAGASGSGKSTLLNVIAGIDPPESGIVTVAGKQVYDLSDDQLSDFRGKNIGFIFQNFNLLPVLTAYENVEYPLLMAGVDAGERTKRVRYFLEAVGLKDKQNNRPGQMSGGQRQRVAIARALATRPALILADEPTANLDSETGQTIIGLMRQMQRDHKVSFVVSSHDPRVLAEADDAIHIADGRVLDVQRKKH